MPIICLGFNDSLKNNKPTQVTKITVPIRTTGDPNDKFVPSEKSLINVIVPRPIDSPAIIE